MKQYIKDGVIRYANEIQIVKNGMRTFSPSHAMLIDDGWEEYVQSDADKLSEAIERLKDDIKWYDASPRVNVFYINDTPLWLDKATRAGLKLRFEAELATGKSETTLWADDTQYTLPLDKAMQMLYALEVYASECYDKTQVHLANATQLTTIAEVEDYNYKVGYPVKLRF